MEIDVIKYILVMILIVAAFIGYFGKEDAIKAPLFTLIGSAILVIIIYPKSIPTLEQIFLLSGTVIIALGAVFWLSSAIKGKRTNWPVPVSFALVLISFSSWMIVYFIYSWFDL